MCYNKQVVNDKARWSSGQDASLSRWKHGFDSRTGHQKRRWSSKATPSSFLSPHTRNLTRQVEPQARLAGFAYPARRSESGLRSKTFSRRRARVFSPKARFPNFIQAPRMRCLFFFCRPDANPFRAQRARLGSHLPRSRLGACSQAASAQILANGEIPVRVTPAQSYFPQIKIHTPREPPLPFFFHIFYKYLLAIFALFSYNEYNAIPLPIPRASAKNRRRK